MSQTIVSEFRLKLYPKDFVAMRKFYEETLGFIVLNEWDRGETDRGVMFQVGSAVLEVLTPENAYQPIAGSGLSLEVPDVHELWTHLKDEVPVIFELRDNSWGDTSFCIADPEGFELTFFTETS
ncbi:MAG TPA: VOC family protein [Candidatus Saccharimonadales bacterium]|nr:VOC family protein [Candidatus Saccharimonadales bacterium]